MNVEIWDPFPPSHHREIAEVVVERVTSGSSISCYGQADTESTGEVRMAWTRKIVTLPKPVPNVPDASTKEGETGDEQSDFEEALVPYKGGFKVSRVLYYVVEGSWLTCISLLHCSGLTKTTVACAS